MTRLNITLTAGALFASGLAMTPEPALAQNSSGEITVFGTDPCPRSTDSQVYVCSHRPESERFRLPKSQQLQGTRQQGQSWAKQSQALSTVGGTGPGSCSSVGPGGFTGCLTQEIKQARRDTQEQQQGDQVPPQR